MRKSTLITWVSGLALLASVVPAHAQATRTWVSGTGNDANPCSRTAPCKTFAGAITKTAPAGEIDVLDPGGYGALVITKSISIYNDGVGEAGVLVSGTNGIVIAAGPNDIVNLRGLVFNGTNGPGSTTGGALNGVLINSALRVTIQNCVIQEFGNGETGQAGVLIATASGTIDVKIQDTTIMNNPAGVFARPSGGTVTLAIDRSRIDQNAGGGVRLDGTGGGTVIASVNDSSMSFNGGNGLVSVTGPGSATASVTRGVFLANQGAGVASNQAAGGSSTVVVGYSMIANNIGGAVSFTPGAALQTYQAGGSGTNQLIGAGGTGFSGPIALQ